MKTQTCLISLFSCLFLVNNIQAQLTFGIQGSYQNAWQDYGDDFDGNGQKIKGYSTSLLAYYTVGNNIELGTEPGYVRRGAACEPGFFIDNPYLSGDATLYANYLTAPVFVKTRKSIFKGSLDIFVKGGGGPSWLVDGYRQLDLEWGPADDTQIQDINFDEETNLRRLDVGLNAGAGFEVRLGPGAVQFSYEYYHSLRDMNEEMTSKNRSMGYALGYVIRL